MKKMLYFQRHITFWGARCCCAGPRILFVVVFLVERLYHLIKRTYCLLSTVHKGRISAPNQDDGRLDLFFTTCFFGQRIVYEIRHGAVLAVRVYDYCKYKYFEFIVCFSICLSVGNHCL